MELNPITINISFDNAVQSAQTDRTKPRTGVSAPLKTQHTAVSAEVLNSTLPQRLLANAQVTLVIFMSGNGEITCVQPSGIRRLPIKAGTSLIITGNSQTYFADWEAPNELVKITVDRCFFSAVLCSLNLTTGGEGILYHYGPEADLGSLASRLTDRLKKPAVSHGSLAINEIQCPAMARFIIAMMLKTRTPETCCAVAQSPKLRLSDTRYSKVVQYVEKRLTSPIHVAELASVATQSHFHFTRTFKARTGQSPHAYILERRLRRAEYFLAETKIGLAQISHECGFSSQSHFSTTFKQCVGITPGQYREGYFQDACSMEGLVLKDRSRAICPKSSAPPSRTAP